MAAAAAVVEGPRLEVLEGQVVKALDHLLHLVWHLKSTKHLPVVAISVSASCFDFPIAS